MLHGPEKDSGWVEKFTEYLPQNPKSPWAHQALGEWLVLNGRPGDARKEFTEAKALDSSFSPAHMMLVQIDTAEGGLDSAREGLKRVLARDDQNATALYPLANIEVQAGRSDAALEHYKKAIQLQPEDVEALNNLASCCSTRASPTKRWPMATRASLAVRRRRSQNTIGWAWYLEACTLHRYSTCKRRSKKMGASYASTI